jgi:hypothetical protein
MDTRLLLRFRDFPSRTSTAPLKSLIELASGREFTICEDLNAQVDVEITGPYSGDSDAYPTPFLKRASRGLLSRVTRGEHLSIPSLAVGITPNPLAKVNIWYTGENQRPPFGAWDAYLSFDAKFPKTNNFYFPLWMLTSTDLILKLEQSYWGRNSPTVLELMSPRVLSEPKKKFACAFLGKNYRLRLHAISELRRIDEVDVFGPGSRRPVDRPSEIARDYRFTICFENDLYPGYVTEKPFEAYLSGSVPIYYGIDSERYLNSSALLNLYDYDSQEKWLAKIRELNRHEDLYNSIYSQPLLSKSPDLSKLLEFLRTKLHGL